MQSCSLGTWVCSADASNPARSLSLQMSGFTRMRQVAPKGCPDTHHASTLLRGAPFSRNIKMRRIRRPVSVNPSLTLESLRSRALKTRVPSIIANSGSNKPASGALSAPPNAVSRFTHLSLLQNGITPAQARPPILFV